MYPASGLPHICPNCGGFFDISSLTYPTYRESSRTHPGIWRWRQSFGLSDDSPMTYLGEGDTPLVCRQIEGRQVCFKLEYLNPTGSFKDRGTAVLTSLLVSRGIHEVVEDSSGNAGASLAFYTAAYGIHSKIFVPASASGPKGRQMEASGAAVIPIPGPRENAHRAVLQMVSEGSAAYASHALLPFGIPGIATIAYELYEQLGRLPGTIVAPVGHGSLAAGIYLGVEALRNHFRISEPISIVGIQPERCAPLAAGWKGEPFLDGKQASIAEGTQITNPVRGDLLLRLMRPDKDDIIAVDEAEILPAVSDLAKMGFYVEPTSAMVWAAFKRHAQEWKEPVVLVLTGSGLKFS